MKLPSPNMLRAALSVVAASATLACGDGTTEPDPVVFQVIEETEFAASLAIDLSEYTLSSGVYIKDEVVGTGETLILGDFAYTSYTGWLSDGTLFGSGPFDFTLGIAHSIRGYELGILGMKVGGTRRIIIPPLLGYGDQGQGIIPPGSILVFEVTLNDLIHG